MQWLWELHRTDPTAQAIAILSLVCVIGMSLGSVRVRGIKLGTAGVLFAGLIVGHFSKPIDHATLEFIKEFGLILFVFCIGLQLGPGFFASLRQSGLHLNLLATAIVLLGSALAVGLGWLAGIDEAATLGILAGATTNTPSLGAAQQTLTSMPDVSAERAALPALAYAVTYPVGILGIIGTLLGIRRLFRIDATREAELHAATERGHGDSLERRALVVDNPNLEGVLIDQIPGRQESGVVISRIRSSSSGEVAVATLDTALQVGDRLLAIGTARGLEQFQRVVGHAADETLLIESGNVSQRRVVVTQSAVLGLSIHELLLEQADDIAVTRLARGDLEFAAVPNVRLRFGDVLQLVGSKGALDQMTAKLGNSARALNETHFIPFFAGIGAGIAVGTFPVNIPGLPQPLRLGLAAGPLIVAIGVGRLGKIGRLVWHMPLNANVAFREFGLALFFASVGLLAGPTFFATAFSTTGLFCSLIGAGVTIVPLLMVGVAARMYHRMNFVVLSGLLAGSMTDPPALAFANNICQSESPAVAYAAVYPWTMLLRIICAQALTVILCG